MSSHFDPVRRRLADANPRVRLATASHLPPAVAAELADELARLLREEPIPAVRRAAVVALGKLPGDAGWDVLYALTDPVWRVRDQAVRALEARVRRHPDLLPELWWRIDAWPDPCPRFRGAAYCLKMRLGHPDPGPVPPAPPEPWRAAPWWDDDPAVLEQTLRRLSADEWKADLPRFAGLLTLQDSKQVRDILSRVRGLVVRAFVRLATDDDLKALEPLLAEVRHPTAGGDARRVLVERRHASVPISHWEPRPAHAAPLDRHHFLSLIHI